MCISGLCGSVLEDVWIDDDETTRAFALDVLILVSPPEHLQGERAMCYVTVLGTYLHPSLSVTLMLRLFSILFGL